MLPLLKIEYIQANVLKNIHVLTRIRTSLERLRYKIIFSFSCLLLSFPFFLFWVSAGRSLTRPEHVCVCVRACVRACVSSACVHTCECAYACACMCANVCTPLPSLAVYLSSSLLLSLRSSPQNGPQMQWYHERCAALHEFADSP